MAPTQGESKSQRQFGHANDRATKQRGFFSLEMIIVLIVALSILGMAAGRVAQLFTASNTTSVASNILGLETSVRSLRTSGGYGSEELTPVLVNVGDVPSGLSVSGSELLNEWGGAVKIQPVSGGVGFTITYPKVPKGVALKVVTQLLGSGNFAAVEINGTRVSAPGTLSEVEGALSGTSPQGVTLIFHVDDQGASGG